MIFMRAAAHASEPKGVDAPLNLEFYVWNIHLDEALLVNILTGIFSYPLLTFDLCVSKAAFPHRCLQIRLHSLEQSGSSIFTSLKNYRCHKIFFPSSINSGIKSQGRLVYIYFVRLSTSTPKTSTLSFQTANYLISKDTSIGFQRN